MGDRRIDAVVVARITGRTGGGGPEPGYHQYRYAAKLFRWVSVELPVTATLGEIGGALPAGAGTGGQRETTDSAWRVSLFHEAVTESFNAVEAFFDVRHAGGVAEAEAVIRSKGNTRNSRNFLGFQ